MLSSKLLLSSFFYNFGIFILVLKTMKSPNFLIVQAWSRAYIPSRRCNKSRLLKKSRRTLF